MSELSTMTHPSWVALHSMAHSFIELDKANIELDKGSTYIFFVNLTLIIFKFRMKMIVSFHSLALEGKK